jgi:hypothetical protein
LNFHCGILVLRSDFFRLWMAPTGTRTASLRKMLIPL